MFKNQPAGLYVLSLANTGERFGYYTMLAIFLLFLQAKFGLDSTVSGQIYAGFLALVYFMPLIGGWVADKWSFSKCVVSGLGIMFLGYMVMAIPTDIRSTSSLVILCAALILIACGTGLFKGNLQVMVGDLYNEARYSGQRDAAFSLFYMAINIGSMFAPMAATAMCNLAMKAQSFTYVASLPAICNAYLDGSENAAELIAVATENGMNPGTDLAAFASNYISTLSTGYSYAFAIACGSLIVSFLIYFLGRRTYAHILTDRKLPGAAKTAAAAGPELTPAQTKQRVVALLLVFAVVIFFWMVFHQNGATLTEFAKSCTSPEASGWTRIGFNVWALMSVAVGVYAIFNLFQSKGLISRLISVVIIALVGWALWYFYSTTPEPLTGIQPQQYQQFNPFYVVALTPFSLALFGWLAKRKSEPSAPRKIGYGMIMAAVARRFPLHRRHLRLRLAQLAHLHLPAPDLRRTPSLTDGHQLRQQGSATQAQRLHDGRMVRRHSRRQLPRLHPHASVGQNLHRNALGHPRRHLSRLRSLHLLHHEEARSRHLRHPRP